MWHSWTLFLFCFSCWPHTGCFPFLYESSFSTGFWPLVGERLEWRGRGRRSFAAPEISISVWDVITHWPSTPVPRTRERVLLRHLHNCLCSPLSRGPSRPWQHSVFISSPLSSCWLVPSWSLSVFLRSFRRLHFLVLGELIRLVFLLFLTRAE